MKIVNLQPSVAELNQLASEIHQSNVDAGWYEGKQSFVVKINLVHSEVSEATDGERKNLMDDHLPLRKMGEVELADALIRLLDLGHAFGLKVIDLDKEMQEVMIHLEELCTGVDRNDMVAFTHLESHYFISCLYGEVSEKTDKVNEYYSLSIQIICLSAIILGYDMFGAMKEKRAYNLNRADHKPENRAKKGGKSF